VFHNVFVVETDLLQLRGRGESGAGQGARCAREHDGLTSVGKTKGVVEKRVGLFVFFERTVASCCCLVCGARWREGRRGRSHPQDWLLTLHHRMRNSSNSNEVSHASFGSIDNLNIAYCLSKCICTSLRGKMCALRKLPACRALPAPWLLVLSMGRRLAMDHNHKRSAPSFVFFLPCPPSSI
jgi:hypothetical protein